MSYNYFPQHVISTGTAKETSVRHMSLWNLIWPNNWMFLLSWPNIWFPYPKHNVGNIRQLNSSHHYTRISLRTLTWWRAFHWVVFPFHFCDVIKTVLTSQITSLTIVYSTIYSGTDQRKHQSSASLAFVQGIHQSLVNSPHKGPLTRKMFPFDDGIMGKIGAGLVSTVMLQEQAIVHWGQGCQVKLHRWSLGMDK